MPRKILQTFKNQVLNNNPTLFLKTQHILSWDQGTSIFFLKWFLRIARVEATAVAHECNCKLRQDSTGKQNSF